MKRLHLGIFAVSLAVVACGGDNAAPSDQPLTGGVGGGGTGGTSGAAGTSAGGNAGTSGAGGSSGSGGTTNFPACTSPTQEGCFESYETCEPVEQAHFLDRCNDTCFGFDNSGRLPFYREGEPLPPVGEPLN